MEFREPVKERLVTDYDFAFVGGGRLPITLDMQKGDFLSDMGDTLHVTLVEKPNPVDPENPIPGERIVIFKRNLNAYTEKTRMQREPTAEELFELQKTLHAMAKGIQ